MGLLITIQAALNSKIKRLPIISQMTIVCAINLIPIFWTTLSGSRNKKNQSSYEIRSNRKVLRSQMHTRPDKMSIAGKILMGSLFDQESKANKKKTTKMCVTLFWYLDGNYLFSTIQFSDYFPISRIVLIKTHIVSSSHLYKQCGKFDLENRYPWAIKIELQKIRKNTRTELVWSVLVRM